MDKKYRVGIRVVTDQGIGIRQLGTDDPELRGLGLTTQLLGLTISEIVQLSGFRRINVVLNSENLWIEKDEEV